MPPFDSRIISDYVVVDLETTGLSPENDRIIEIAAVRVINDAVADTFSTLVDPHRHIDRYITEITGIDDNMVKGAPDIGEAMPRFLEFLGDMPILGHNVIRFDLRFLQAVSDLEVFCVDTLDIANHMHTGSYGKSLTALCARFGVINDNAHRALSDCLATHGVYQKMKEHYRNNGAYFTMAVSCGRKAYQENIRAKCRRGTVLTAEKDAKGALLLSAGGCPVGTVSGSRQEEFEENIRLVREITVSKLTENAKGKLLLGAEVRLGGR
ncbi:MAG: PolC-type DNA polymerase III [Huintestinicola sp.]|uniref:3'-5' exonuclease n=1 Tax=Huintestinicola sp. TaxID=2981661 RepID=UPI003F0597B7